MFLGIDDYFGTITFEIEHLISNELVQSLLTKDTLKISTFFKCKSIKLPDRSIATNVNLENEKETGGGDTGDLPQTADLPNEVDELFLDKFEHFIEMTRFSSIFRNHLLSGNFSDAVLKIKDEENGVAVVPTHRVFLAGTYIIHTMQKSVIFLVGVLHMNV